MTTRLGKDEQAYNACIDALNEYEAAITALVLLRDNVWVAADALGGTKNHGAEQRGRNLTIKNGYIQR